MATLASTIDPPPEVSKTDTLPCIYGEEVCSECSVRLLLSKPSLSKWQKPKNAALDDFQGIINMATSVFDPAIMGLSNFCQNCPHADVFTTKKAFELEGVFLENEKAATQKEKKC